MTNYAVEYLDEEGEIRVMIFNRNGIIEEYTSAYFIGRDYEEPKPSQFYLCRLEGDYQSPIGEIGQSFTFLGAFTGFEDETGEFETPAYEKKWCDLDWLCDIAEQIEKDPDKFMKNAMTPEEFSDRPKTK